MNATIALTLVIAAAEAHVKTLEARAERAARDYNEPKSSALMDAASDLKHAIEAIKPADFPMDSAP
jgi:hypothetical protein